MNFEDFGFDLKNSKRIVLERAPPHTWKIRPMRRKPAPYKAHPLVAYDLETTNIAKGTPKLKYITAFGESLRVSAEVTNPGELLDILLAKFLTEENDGFRFVAWNGNRYDAYFIAHAVLQDSRFTIRPYLTGKHQLRGLRVTREGAVYQDGRKKKKVFSWEFLDGMAMTGIEKGLKKFLEVFAPEYGKLDLDFSKTSFDARKPSHVAYAERDSEGLYHGLQRANSIMQTRFGVGLNPTIGNTGIKIFQSKLPATVACWRPGEELENVLRTFAVRGGYCYCVKRYEGDIYKYDLNQAYAAAMREAKLPAGKAIECAGYVPGKPALYKVTGRLKNPLVPLYIKNEKGHGVAVSDELTGTWLTSIEYDQLVAEGIQLDIEAGYVWTESFSMLEMVDELEHARMNAPGGPSGAEGLMIKAVGNNSFGKTLERLTGESLVMSLTQPAGFTPYAPEDPALEYIWSKNETSLMREYHCPQIGCFITAHVRMVVRRAALQAPRAWLYADTDCVVFSDPIALPTHPSKYGEWKIEVWGKPYRIIGKKVYCSLDGKVKHAKGMNVDKLSADDFSRWFSGHPPEQSQLHRKNFLRFLGDTSNMFSVRERIGELKAEPKL